MSAISPVPKPTVIPQWAATTPGGAPVSGTCVQPPSSSSDSTVITQQTGWIPGTAPPAQYDNYFKNLVCQWIAYLADINNQRFTDAGVGSWSYPHVFDAGVTATNTSGPAITATGSGISPAILATANGLNPAIEATSNTAAAAISATGYNGGTVFSPAIMATGGGAIGSAAVVVTGAVEADGIQTTGGGVGAGITATGGPSDLAPGGQFTSVAAEGHAILLTSAADAMPLAALPNGYLFGVIQFAASGGTPSIPTVLNQIGISSVSLDSTYTQLSIYWRVSFNAAYACVPGPSFVSGAIVHVMTKDNSHVVLQLSQSTDPGTYLQWLPAGNGLFELIAIGV